MSPSTLAFVLNSVQNTLPDPANLRRWNLSKSPACALCHWKNVSHVHILCGCKVALDQGRISYRHDSILKVIHHYVTIKIASVSVITPLDHLSSAGLGKQINFVKKGRQQPKQRKKPITGLLDIALDWTVHLDLRTAPVQFPPHILVTLERPDIVIFSNLLKVVIMIELTSPAEENIEKWRVEKNTKYNKLAEYIIEGGIWKPYVFTIEVGARGFVNNTIHKTCRILGIDSKATASLIKDASRTAIRTSHFIWINRNNKLWRAPELMQF